MSPPFPRRHRLDRVAAHRLVGIISLSDIAEFDGGHAAITLNEISRREARSDAGA